MFKVENTILADDIATAKFSCDLSRCKGACCVVGDAGAPVVKSEIVSKSFEEIFVRLGIYFFSS